jgi:predicted acyltransferase (DUF342 family)
VQLGPDPLDELVIPDGTTAEERDLVVDRDVLVGGQSTVEFGVRGRNVLGGERVTFGGGIEADGDCRLDMWCDVDGSVLVGRDAYLGERVHIAGQLVVAGDLDIGDDVDIEEGFEANGWIVIRNPMPTIVFLVVYLSHLLRLGEEEAAEEFVSEVFEEESEGEPLVIPRSSNVSDDAWRVSTPARIGDGVRLHGNLRAKSIEFGRDGVIFGSLRARGDVVVGRGAEVKGDVTTRGGTVRVGPGATIWGDVSAEDVELHENATVEGAIRARGEMRMHTDEVIDRPDETAEAMAEQAEALEAEADADVDDGVDVGAEEEETVDEDVPADEEGAETSEAVEDESDVAPEEQVDASD